MKAPDVEKNTKDLVARFTTAVIAIRDHYASDTRDVLGGKQKKRLRNGVVPPSVLALEGDFAEVLRTVANDSGRLYKVKASAGQPDRSFLLVPYAMLMRNDVTTTPRRGVYVALLFQQDCKALWLTLNQGLSQFEQRFGLVGSRKYLRQGANAIASSLTAPSGFLPGSIALQATTPYGRAYEEGAIFSKRYELERFAEDQGQEFFRDLYGLIELYNSLPAYSVRDPSVAVENHHADDDEATYQGNANSKSDRRGAVPIDDSPQSRSSKGVRKSVAWVRDVQVARVSLEQVGYRCEAACNYELFRAAAADHPYVEAHHLIPLANQNDFEFSLDVPANIVCLCPGCHAKVHRGHKSVRDPLILQLHKHRLVRLKAAGLNVDANSLLALY